MFEPQKNETSVTTINRVFESAARNIRIGSSASFSVVTFFLSVTDIGPTLDVLARRKMELETGLAVSGKAFGSLAAAIVSSRKRWTE